MSYPSEVQSSAQAEVQHIEVEILCSALEKHLGISLAGFDLVYSNEATGGQSLIYDCVLDSKKRRLVFFS